MENKLREPMVYQMGYNILMVFAMMDGHYNPRRGYEILKFLKGCIADLEILQIGLLGIPKGRVSQHFVFMLNLFSIEGTQEDKVDLVASAYTIYLDNETPEGKRVIRSMCRKFELDPDFIEIEIWNK